MGILDNIFIPPEIYFLSWSALAHCRRQADSAKHNLLGPSFHQNEEDAAHP
jgi:hypothetical protein